MNSALQALSNTPPLTRYFLDCGPSSVKSEKKPNLAQSYLRLMQEMWHHKRLSYVTPSNVLYGIRNVLFFFAKRLKIIKVIIFPGSPYLQRVSAARHSGISALLHGSTP